MLALLFVFVVYAFLFLGSVMFVICALDRKLRRYAFSADLWFAALGPCLVCASLVLGVGFLAVALDRGHLFVRGQLPALLAGSGWFATDLVLLASIAIASLAAYLHQALIGRLTFALFRLYATAVSGGIGSVFAWALGLWRPWNGHSGGGLYLGLAFLLLVVGFGSAAYRHTRLLRGPEPTRFTWISPEEYAG